MSNPHIVSWDDIKAQRNWSIIAKHNELGLTQQEAVDLQMNRFYLVDDFCKAVYHRKNKERLLKIIKDPKKVEHLLKLAKDLCKIHEHEGGYRFAELSELADVQKAFRALFWGGLSCIKGHTLVDYKDAHGDMQQITARQAADHYKMSGYDPMNRVLLESIITDSKVRAVMSPTVMPFEEQLEYCAFDYCFLQAILDLPRYHDWVVLYRNLGRGGGPGHAMYRVGEVAPIHSFLSTGLNIGGDSVGGLGNEIDNATTFMEIQVPPYFPMYLFYDKFGYQLFAMYGMEQSEVILPYTTDHTGMTVTHGILTLKEEFNKPVRLVSGKMATVKRYITCRVVPLDNPVPVRNFPMWFTESDPTVVRPQKTLEMIKDPSVMKKMIGSDNYATAYKVDSTGLPNNAALFIPTIGPALTSENLQVK